MVAQKEKIRIIIADDHEVVREGLAQILSQISDMTVVKKVKNGIELLEQTRMLELDIVLLDLDMPEKNGWDVMRQLKIEYPNLPIIVFSASPEEDSAKLCFQEGASGYLEKVSSMELIVEAIRQVVQGEKYISPNLANVIAINEIVFNGKPPHKNLSSREFEVFRLIALGKSVNDISVELSLSASTISTYRTRILKKMNLSSNAQLIRYAYKQGILS